MTKRGAVIAQVIVYGAIVTVVSFFVAATVSHEKRIDMLAENMARSLKVQERAIEDIDENRQMMIDLLKQVCRIEGAKEGRGAVKPLSE